MIHYTNHSPGRTVQLNGKEYRYFGGTSYLGIQTDPDFRELLVKHQQYAGTGHGASRLSNLRLSVYEEAEAQLAGQGRCEAALLVSSGFLAGQLVAAHFDSLAYTPFYAPGAHAALCRGGQPSFANMASLTRALTEHLSSGKTSTPVVFTDSLDFSGQSYPDYPALRALPLHALILVVDDSHGFGLLGGSGEGAVSRLAELGAGELLICASMGKAWGIPAGMVTGTKSRIAALKESAFFAGASPPPPAYIHAYLEAGSLYATRREQLRSIQQAFTSEIPDLLRFFQYVPHHPLYAFNRPLLTRHLYRHDMLVTDFNYPSTTGDPLPGRLVLSAHHLQRDIRDLARVIRMHFAGRI